MFKESKQNYVGEMVMISEASNFVGLVYKLAHNRVITFQNSFF